VCLKVSRKGEALVRKIAPLVKVCGGPVEPAGKKPSRVNPVSTAQGGQDNLAPVPSHRGGWGRLSSSNQEGLDRE
jgi:hypothetical protein